METPAELPNKPLLLRKNLKSLWVKLLDLINRYPFAASLAGTLLIAGTLLGAHRLYLSTTTDVKLAIWESKQNARREEQRDNYQALLEKQREESADREHIDRSRVAKTLNGKQTVHFVFARPSSVSKSASQNFLDLWSGAIPDSRNDESTQLQYIETYLTEQQARYADQNPELENEKKFELEVVLHPEIYILDLEQVGDTSNPWGRDAYSINRLQDQFDGVITDNNLPIEEGEAVLFFFFDPETSASIDVVESFYDHKAFRSFAVERDQRAYINVYTLQPNFTNILTEIAIHEYLHLYGATDKYKETSYGCSEKALGDLEQNPRFPQETADIMCGLIQIGRDDFERARLSEGELVINSITAEEIGWISPDEE